MKKDIFSAMLVRKDEALTNFPPQAIVRVEIAEDDDEWIIM